MMTLSYGMVVYLSYVSYLTFYAWIGLKNNSKVV